MKKKIAASCCAAALSLSLCACGANQDTVASSAQEDDGTLTILATTYPVYCFTKTIVDGMDGIEVKLMIDQQISCLHDYTLTVDDMRAIESADVIVINGAGLEEFMDDALSTSTAPVIDCSEGIELLPYAGHEDHDDGDEADSEHYDPHIWMDPNRAIAMMENIARGLAAVDDTHTEQDYLGRLIMPSANINTLSAEWKERFDALPADQKNLITFHDGFAYFADAFGLTILKSIEEEAGSEASAKEIAEIVGLVNDNNIPMIFVEENGSDATAKAIQRETGVEIGTLTMMMSDNGMGYYDVLDYNLRTVYEGLSGTEVDSLAQ